MVIRIQITPQDSDTPVAEQLIQRSAVYDVWDEIYTLQFERKKFKVKFRAEALKWLTAIEDLPVARLAVLPVDQVFVLKMVVELNPVSKETLAEVRRYAKLFWINSGPYHNLTARKFVLKCSPEAFTEAVKTAVKNGARLEGPGLGPLFDHL